MIERIKTFMNNPVYFITSPASKGFLNWVPDALYLKIIYRLIMGVKCNLKNPVTYNEKLQWLKLHDRKPEYEKMVDKYEVRDYIAKTLGEEYLIPCYGVYNSFEEIDFSKLPKQFVLKCTHDSGSVEICKDKANFDFEGAKDRLTTAMGKNYYNTYREWPYKNVKPRIIVEKFMVEEADDDLKDYKFMCFNGAVKCAFTCTERFSEDGLKVTFFDEQWNELPFTRKYPRAEKPVEKPLHFDEMKKIAEKVSHNIPFIRVDFYEVNGKLFIGELTLFPGSGLEVFEPAEWDSILGRWINLGEERQILRKS